MTNEAEDQAIAMPERATIDLWPTVAKMLGISKNSVYEAARRGQIPGLFRIGSRFLVKRDVFLAFLAGAHGGEPATAATWPPSIETR
jgi:excisionase family DNA binding protein